MTYFFGLLYGAPVPIFSTLNGSGDTFSSLGERCQPAAQSQRIMLLKMIISLILPSLSLSARPGPALAPSVRQLNEPRALLPTQLLTEPHSIFSVCANFLPQSDLFLYVGIRGDVVSQGGQDTRELPRNAEKTETNALF